MLVVLFTSTKHLIVHIAILCVVSETAMFREHSTATDVLTLKSQGGLNDE
jgi:hypothetical protein